jgi:hypothetical protein
MGLVMLGKGGLVLAVLARVLWRRAIPPGRGERRRAHPRGARGACRKGRNGRVSRNAWEARSVAERGSIGPGESVIVSGSCGTARFPGVVAGCDA